MEQRTTCPLLKEIKTGDYFYTTVIPKRYNVRIRKCKKIKLEYID